MEEPKELQECEVCHKMVEKVEKRTYKHPLVKSRLTSKSEMCDECAKGLKDMFAHMGQQAKDNGKVLP